MNKINLMSIIKLVFYKKKYISELCEYYGEPKGVRDHLLFLVNSYPIFSKHLSKEIARFNQETKDDEEYRMSIINYIEEEPRQGGCYDCPWGNGEGGCTIPGYCTDSEE